MKEAKKEFPKGSKVDYKGRVAIITKHIQSHISEISLLGVKWLDGDTRPWVINPDFVTRVT